MFWRLRTAEAETSFLVKRSMTMIADRGLTVKPRRGTIHVPTECFAERLERHETAKSGACGVFFVLVPSPGGVDP